MKKPLYGEAEQWTDDCRAISREFDALIRDKIVEWEKLYSSRDLEVLLIQEIVSIMAELRVRRGMEQRKQKQNE